MLNGPSRPLDNTGAIALSTQTASVNSLTATLTCSAVSNTGHHPRPDDTPQHKGLHLPAASPSRPDRRHQNRRAELDNTRPSRADQPGDGQHEQHVRRGLQLDETRIAAPASHTHRTHRVRTRT